MATFHVKNGQVEWDANGGQQVLSNVISWQCSVTSDVAEATAMGDTYKTYTSGFKDWTAQATCRLESGSLEIPLAEGGTEALGENTPAKLELWFDSTAASRGILYGSAICVDITVNQESSDNVQVTYSFQGTDTLTFGTSAPTY